MKDKLRKRKEERVESGKQSALTEEGVEGGSDNYSGKHEGNGGECSQEGFAAKVEAGEEVGRGKSEEEREEGGEDGLIRREE